MIVNAQITVENTSADITAHINSHPSIIERSPIRYQYINETCIMNTRMQIETQDITCAENIILQSLTIESTEDTPVDENSLPEIILTLTK